MEKSSRSFFCTDLRCVGDPVQARLIQKEHPGAPGAHKIIGGSISMENKAYLQAKGEFWNCIRMAPFTLCTSLIFAFGEWLPAMRAAKAAQG